jgi:D-lactate dehydrogenase (cytochrome)
MLGRTKIRRVMFGHAGNNNFHINFLPVNDREYGEAMELYDGLAREIAAMGGTISSEHGIGKLKRKYLKYMYGREEIEAMKKIKSFFDPQNICCPGNVFE